MEKKVLCLSKQVLGKLGISSCLAALPLCGVAEHNTTTEAATSIKFLRKTATTYELFQPFSPVESKINRPHYPQLCRGRYHHDNHGIKGQACIHIDFHNIRCPQLPQLYRAECF